MGGRPLTYLHADHLGSTVFTTNVSGNQNQKYHAYGATRSGGVPSDYQFTGQEADSGTGLIYMKARYYDPVIGQFISPDTIVPDPNNLYAYNRYMYAYGNPLKYSDPNGHEPWLPQLPHIPNPFELLARLLGLPSDEDIEAVTGVSSVSTNVGYQVYQALDATNEVIVPPLEGALSLMPGYDVATAISGKTVTGTSLDPTQRVMNIVWFGVGFTSYDTVIEAGRSLGKTHAHHWLPQSLHDDIRAAFPEVSNNLLQWTEPLVGDFHRTLHGKGGTLLEAYNDRVTSLLSNPNITTLDQFLGQLSQLRDEYMQLYEEYVTLVQ